MCGFEAAVGAAFVPNGGLDYGFLKILQLKFGR